VIGSGISLGKGGEGDKSVYSSEARQESA